MAREPANKRRRLSPPEENGDGAPGFARWNLEQDYENRPRKTKKEDKHAKLPIKTAEGWIEQATEAEPVQEDEDNYSFLGSGDDEEDSGVADLAEQEEVKPKVPVKEQILQAKEELARIAGSVGEDPEENINLLGALAGIANSKNVTIKKLALATQLAVYKDIVPGYRIRPLSKEDQQAKVGKDVRKLRNFEQALVHGYKDYTQALAKLAKVEGKEGIATVAISCACNLLTSLPHFNCRNELIAILVLRLSTRKHGADFDRCRDAFEQLFKEDEDGNASLEAVRQLTQMMKSKGYNIHESVLNTFLHLRLLSELAHRGSTNHIDKPEEDTKMARRAKSKKEREFRTKRERKVMKERKGIEKEMREADAVVSYEERDKNQSEMLKLVFVAYFRILKARTPNLMGAVLEGLARYAHLINQDFFGDILEALKDLINDAEALLNSDADEEGAMEADPDLDARAQRNATRESLLCIITAFALLQGQDVAKSASALNLDLNFFITHLYRTLLPIALNPDIELSAKSQHLRDPNGLPTPAAKDTKVNVATTTVLLLRSLQSVLLPPTSTKSVPPVRVAAFTKQLLLSSLHLPQKSILAVLSLLQQVTKTHQSKVAALWNTEERRGDGVFDAVGGEVEGSNPFAATVWEGELLRCHFDPRVRDAVKAMEKNVVQSR